MALAGVEGTISGDACDLLIGGDLVEPFRQHGRVADIAGGELSRPDFQCLLFDPDVDLAPYTALRAAMLAGVPFTFAFDLDPRAVDQQVQRALRAAIGDVDLQGLLAPAEGAEVRHSPVQVDQLQEAFDEAGRLAQRHAEQHLYRQTGLDCGVTLVRLSASFAGGLSLPSHGGIKPYRQQAATLERFIVGWPVSGPVDGGYGFAHAAQLPRWIHKMNPSSDLCNRAAADMTANEQS